MPIPKIIIYTAITSSYDSMDIMIPEANISYYLFTDDLAIPAATFWNKSLLANPSNLNRCRLSRLPKLRPHHFLPPHDISVYIDANLTLKRPIYDFAINCVKDMPIAVHPHPNRKCLYDEAKTCIHCKLDDPLVINVQMNRYQREGFPRKFGLTENKFIVRCNDAEVARFNELWNLEYLKGSQRDQLSFMYCVWKTGLPLFKIPQHSRRNTYYKSHGHLLPRMRYLKSA